MFDIIGYWVAATMFCVPPFLLLGMILLTTANTQVRKESGGKFNIPLYNNLRDSVNDIDNVWISVSIASFPSAILLLTFGLDGHQRYDIVGWISKASEAFSGFFGGLGMVVVALIAVKMLAKLYAKFIILSEKVKTL
ncbi:hypothetical protein LAh6_148 [Aeromonas phage LAh_6]|uniref:Uncharacterized protein n=1 Tax=Aeromonas phage LAh_6 TaxID=2591030 RepID=A0A513ZZW8_9CAUD|nr:hypothetical protein HWC30_gp148 [Aeromonas phage LAh_6]QDH46551.1 hypothetical protein LAh6_148 [Aeromonas phage LAh_6]